MNTPEQILNRVQDKVQQLLKQYEAAQKENEKSKKTIDSLILKQSEQEEHIRQLEQQALILKASVSSLDESDKKDLEQKLNTYIKSIDKCISLLST